MSDYIKKGKNGTFMASCSHADGQYKVSISKLCSFFWDCKDHITTNNEEKAKAKFAEYKDRVNRLAKGVKE